MSLWHAYSQGGQVFVCADSRVSIEEKGQHYRVSDKYRKLRCIGQKIVFMSGNVEFDIEFFSSLKSSDSIQRIQAKLMMLYQNYKKRFSMPLKFDITVAIILIEKQENVLYQMNSKEEFKLNRHIMQEQELFNMGAHSERATSYLTRLTRTYPQKTIPEIIQITYEKVADETVGGYLHSYVISQASIQRNTQKIRDRKSLRTWEGDVFPYECSDYDAI